ncbi:hypothetical protein Y032_0660g1270 [Ancylostoma ceylanicum]|uniref:SRCR domain-containing protein n=1 Tax=Ancylostoma ceylanicum TaxID=53326 RepID=A0A016WK07_9BILA|nr:hypothetical protein Y032_0660g1270 [Ancylostoma ceylanicum]
MTEFDSFPREWKAACANLWKLILHDCSRCSFLGAGAASSRETTGSGDGLDHESLSSGNQPDNVNCSGTKELALRDQWAGNMSCFWRFGQLEHNRSAVVCT